MKIGPLFGSFNPIHSLPDLSHLLQDLNNETEAFEDSDQFGIGWF